MHWLKYRYTTKCESQFICSLIALCTNTELFANSVDQNEMLYKAEGILSTQSFFSDNFNQQPILYTTPPPPLLLKRMEMDIREYVKYCECCSTMASNINNS